MEDFKKNWDVQHIKYSQAAWINQPTLFAQEMVLYFPKNAEVLDIGCGQGQDSRFFAQHGHSVVGVDISSEAVAFAEQKTQDEFKSKIIFKQLDISKGLYFKDKSFDVVYSHLALHYFDAKMTEDIFNEVYRVIRSNGVFIVLVNSVNDPEYGSGEKVEEDYFHIGNMYKRFFSKDTIKKFAKKFEIVIADEEGETYKDRIIGNSYLVRLVAKKS